MKNNRSPLVPSTIVDKNGVPRKVWKKPEISGDTSNRGIPSPAPDGKSRITETEAKPKNVMQRASNAVRDFFATPEPIREQLRRDHPKFTTHNYWISGQSEATLYKVKEILDSKPGDDWGLVDDLRRPDPSPETIKVVHANREFLSDSMTPIRFLTGLAEAMGPKYVKRNGRIRNIEAHCTVGKAFDYEATGTKNTSSVKSYSEASALWTAVNQHPEMAEDLAKWSSETIRKGRATYFTNTDKSGDLVAIVETTSMYPDQADEINDFAHERGYFNLEAYEEFRSYGAVQEGML